MHSGMIRGLSFLKFSACMSNSSAPGIRFNAVEKSFADVNALNGVSFEIPRGSYFGLLGPNGAGKSTLINAAAGLVRCDAGSIEVMGFDVKQQYRGARAALGLVPQELVYDPFFSVIELLRLQAGYFGLGRENHAWIDELIETLELSDKRHANLHSLSGGMKRRALIAQALVHKPPVVVLDEPTAGVDVELRQSLWRFTRRLHAEGHTIVLTTHYLEEAEALCDEIAILDHGGLAALEGKKELLARHPYRRLTLTLEQHDAQLPDALQAMLESREGAICVLRLDKQRDTVGAVIDQLHASGCRIEDLNVTEASLEDVFLSLTGSEREVEA